MLGKPSDFNNYLSGNYLNFRLLPFNFLPQDRMIILSKLNRRIACKELITVPEHDFNELTKTLKWLHNIKG